MADTLFLNPARALQSLMDRGIAPSDAIAHLVRLKDTEFAIRYDGTSYFDPRELERITE